MPAQEVDVTGDRYRLEYREMLPVESWNAQISLLTGFAAAWLMLDGEVGILRTLPPAPEHEVRALRRTARALGIDWPNTMGHPEFIRSLDPSRPAEAAMVVACTRLLRGAGYAAFEGRCPETRSTLRWPRRTPMSRRRCDGWSTATAWRSALPCARAPRCRPGSSTAWTRLPEVMRDSGSRSHAYENAVLNLVEALTLRTRVGENFEGVVLERRARRRAQGHRDDPRPRRRGDGGLRPPRSRSVRTSPSRWPRRTRRPAESASRTERPYPWRADGLAGRPRHLRGNSEVSRKVRAPQDEVVGNSHPG